ncbi:MAG: matrixin family metalloprotease [Proteobacteria bacterium]|nr:matrixin family metalloprotease [Pseudomonadota bacterium]
MQTLIRAGSICGITLLGLWMLVAPSVVFAQSPSERPDYRLLMLDGNSLKWGIPQAGTPGLIRYAHLTKPMHRDGARNCRAMAPLPVRLGPGGVARETIIQEFRDAFAAWQRVAAVRFEEADNIAEADLVIGIQSEPAGIAFADVSYRPEPGARFARIHKAAICLNPTLPWESSFDGDIGTYNLRAVAMHEVGHAIGLDHAPGKTAKVMNFRYLERVRDLQPGDIAGAVEIYGPAETAAAQLPRSNPK